MVLLRIIRSHFPVIGDNLDQEVSLNQFNLADYLINFASKEEVDNHLSPWDARLMGRNDGSS